tara:strand:- start:402 stop:2159 length:1758 start_codon:yes stop_codon:yes gene_type:complete
VIDSEGTKSVRHPTNIIKTFTVPFALEQIKENISINTEIPSELSKKQLINQAFKFHLEGNSSKALKYYQSWLDQGFKDPIVFYNYALILKDLGKLEKAEELTRRAINLKPDFAEAHLNLGNILNDINQLKEAEVSTRNAINLKPDFAEAHCNLGIILKKLDKLIEAELSIRRSIELKPDFAEAYCNLGIILKKLDKLIEAELSQLEAIKIKPNFAVAHHNLANVLKNLGKLQEAEKSHREAIRIQPNFPEAHNNLGNVLKDLGKLQEAEFSIRKAIEIKPDFAEAYANLGGLLSDLGKLKEAKLSLCKALKIQPKFIGAAWNQIALSNNIIEAEYNINQCLRIDKNYLNAKLLLSAIKLHNGDKKLLNNFTESKYKNHPFIRSINWVSNLPEIPKLFFHRWGLFKEMINLSEKNRPFYEFGVWRGISFKYLIKSFKKGYGFDTFEGLPEDWHEEKRGTYTADGIIPKISGGKFIKGKFEETLPVFFNKTRPMASIINFDADLYSSTLCALNFSKPIIDENTILIFDEFIMNKKWEQDEYKALDEFCANQNLNYHVLAISYTSKQVAVKLKGFKKQTIKNSLSSLN